jgi:hypothetical protein
VVSSRNVVFNEAAIISIGERNDEDDSILYGVT